MTSRFLDPAEVKRQEECRYDFNRKSLAGRVVLVPGGIGGLGAAITALLLQEGALPVVGYKSNRGRALAFQQNMQDLYGGPVRLVEGDVAEPEARTRYLEAALGVKGELFGLVALTGDPARVKANDLDGPALQASFRANFEAPVLLARACAEAMKAKAHAGRDRPRVQHAGHLSFRGQPGLRLAQGRPRARGDGSWPRSTEAAWTSASTWSPRAPPAPGMARASIESGKYDAYVERGVVPRFGRPEDIARAVRFLLEPDSYTTGQVITVDGGLTLRRDHLG